MRQWNKLSDLAAMLIVRARQRKKVVLLPDTAHVVGLHLMTAAAKPTRDDVAALICDSKCRELCIPCILKANLIAAAYGNGEDKK